jgi:hypothetical protein
MEDIECADTISGFFKSHSFCPRDCKGDSWQTAEGDSLTEGNANADGTSPEHQSFEWRGGHERMTTGIWMYSEPFFHVAVRVCACLCLPSTGCVVVTWLLLLIVG